MQEDDGYLAKWDPDKIFFNLTQCFKKIYLFEGLLFSHSTILPSKRSIQPSSLSTVEFENHHHMDTPFT